MSLAITKAFIQPPGWTDGSISGTKHASAMARSSKRRDDAPLLNILKVALQMWELHKEQGQTDECKSTPMCGEVCTSVGGSELEVSSLPLLSCQAANSNHVANAVMFFVFFSLPDHCLLCSRLANYNEHADRHSGDSAAHAIVFKDKPNEPQLRQAYRSIHMCTSLDLHKNRMQLEPTMHTLLVVFTQITNPESTQNCMHWPLVLGYAFLLCISLFGWQLAELDMLSG